MLYVYYETATKAILQINSRDDLNHGAGTDKFAIDDADVPNDPENWEVNATNDGLVAKNTLAGNTMEMATDATDSTEPYDGIPDITGDGISTCKIILELKGQEGERNTSATGLATLFTTRGRLSALTADMAGGVNSTIILTSVDESVVAEVAATMDGYPNITNRLQIQFT